MISLMSLAGSSRLLATVLLISSSVLVLVDKERECVCGRCMEGSGDDASSAIPLFCRQGKFILVGKDKDNSE